MFWVIAEQNCISSCFFICVQSSEEVGPLLVLFDDVINVQIPLKKASDMCA